MIRGLRETAQKLGLKVQNIPPKNPKNTKKYQEEINIEQIPMMYRAQVSGRCSLQFAGNNQDLEKWRDEWIYPNTKNHEPRYQHQEPKLGINGTIKRIKIEFPFRLLSNCGQDSIIRPVLGKNGIPFIPGSSIKGLFRRACSPEQAVIYCGHNQRLIPGILRFHRAYPIGDWAGTKEVTFLKKGQNIKEIRYRIVDIIHPQQPRQVEGNGSPKALASISFYQTKFIFEFSSSDENINWTEVEEILLKALLNGVGGKTSTGYGLGGHIPNHQPIIPEYPLRISLQGSGVSPLLRSDEPEFRPNVFKATLRGHVRRLLGGVCNHKNAIQTAEDKIFGSSESPGIVDIFWQVQPEKEIFNSENKTPTYETQGILHINASKTELPFLEKVIKFAFVMGGFGKSWRRISHQKFYRNYPKLADGLHIGCHWECLNPDWVNIKTNADLTAFLDSLYEICKNRLGTKPPQAMNWREAWHPSRVAVYSQVVTESKAVQLFHDDTFKTTPAIGGRNPNDKRPTSFSSVWHRMLPIGNNQYLEILTVFYGNKQPWKHQDKGDQLQSFIKSIQEKGLELAWGKRP